MIHFKLLGMCMSVSDLSPDKHDGRDFSLDFSLRLMCIKNVVIYIFILLHLNSPCPMNVDGSYFQS